MHSIADIDWREPTVAGAAWFAQVKGVDVGYVTRTAFPDGRWRAVVVPWADRDLSCYAASEDQARYFVERYLSHHMPDIEALAAARKAWRDSGPLPRKPKGIDDRS
jgi:hypothetical protein